MAARSDRTCLFLTALLVYAAFWNPRLDSSMTWNYLDAAVSLVDTGRWAVTHTELYGGQDSARAGDRLTLTSPPGMSVLILPFYALWRLVAGPAKGAGGFRALHGFLALAVGAVASALAVAQVAWLVGWLGAGRRGRLWAAALFAFGTQNFAFGTMLFKENVVGLAGITALRLSVEPGGDRRRLAAGVLAGVLPALALPAGLLAPLLLLLVAAREGPRRAALFLAGCVLPALALGAYLAWLFGAPWRTAYHALPGVSGVGLAAPRVPMLFDFLLGPRSGLFLYSPFLVAGLAGLARALRSRACGEAAVTATYLGGLWLGSTAFLSQLGERGSWATGLGSRYLFPAVPLLAAFAGRPLEGMGRAGRLALAAPSLAFGYLSAQAGFIPGPDVLPYAVKTWISGTGMGVFFKEVLPAWLGIPTLHTVVARPDVSAADLLRMLPTAQGWRLVRNQTALLALNGLVLAGIGWLIARIWRDRPGGGAPPPARR